MTVAQSSVQGKRLQCFEYVLICLHSHRSALLINANSEMKYHYSPYCTVMSIIAGSDHIGENWACLWIVFSLLSVCIVSDGLYFQGERNGTSTVWLHCNSLRNIRHFHDISSFQIPSVHSARISHDFSSRLLEKQVFNHSSSTCPWSTISMRRISVVWWRHETLQSRTEAMREDVVSCRAVVPRPELQGCLDLCPLWS